LQIILIYSRKEIIQWIRIPQITT